jgi:hypothetical protein
MERREAVELLSALPFLGGLPFTPGAARRAARFVDALRTSPAQAYAPKFFTAHEWQTVRVLVDLVLPRDARSGSATDAGVPEFMDFILVEYSDHQLWMRGGLGWLDIETRRRFGRPFVDADAAQQTKILDDIAWPDKAPPGMHQGVEFFNKFRDFTASGFFSSEMGVADIRYQGNRFVVDWQGCPPEQLQKLGVRYP